MKKNNKNHKKAHEQKSFFKEHGAAWAIGLAIIIIIATLFSVFKVPLGGKAIATLNSPALDVLDLDRQEGFNINLATNPSWQMKMKGSYATATSTPLDLKMAATVLESGEVNYSLFISNPEDPLSAGILSTALSDPGNIFLDIDNVPDLQLTLSGTQLTVKNPNYVSPSDSKFTLFGQDFRTPLTDKVQYVANGSLLPTVFYINVTTSTGQPTVSPIEFVGMSLGSVNHSWTENRSGSNFKTFQLNLTPNKITPYVLEISSLVGVLPDGKTTKEKYIFASNGLFYEMREENLPVVEFFKSATAIYSVNLTFNPMVELQPFSLPCTVAGGLTMQQAQTIFSGRVNSVYSYGDGEIKQWWSPLSTPSSTSVISNLEKLEVQKGYMIKTIENLNTPMTLKFDCASPLTEGLPDLSPGWNLISASGYKAIPKSELDKKVPAGKVITKVLEVQKNEVTMELTASSNLIPGKAYWVEVR
ncbi:hypothetical protein HYU21_03215 [Candidatus Woesearchaeota archaeon]|nr:hypothetical protein [Candidatus Woesearchaeota archaeon]